MAAARCLHTTALLLVHRGVLVWLRLQAPRSCVWGTNLKQLVWGPWPYILFMVGLFMMGKISTLASSVLMISSCVLSRCSFANLSCAVMFSPRSFSWKLFQTVHTCAVSSAFTVLNFNIWLWSEFCWSIVRFELAVVSVFSSCGEPFSLWNNGVHVVWKRSHEQQLHADLFSPLHCLTHTWISLTSKLPTHLHSWTYSHFLVNSSSEVFEHLTAI